MLASDIVEQCTRTGGLLVQCISCPKGSDCLRITAHAMAHWRLVWLYLPLAVLVLLVVPGLVFLGRSLHATTYRRHRKQKQQLLGVFAGVIVMAAVAGPLIGWIHIWGIDAILGGLVLWGFGSIAVVRRLRSQRGRAE